MKWIKKVATTPLSTIAQVIDSLSGASATNAPSINAVNAAINNLLTALDNKQDEITGSASTVTSGELTANRAVISNGSKKIAVSNTTSTELGYVHGVTSNIQNQIDGKENAVTLTANHAVVSDANGKLAASSVTATQLGRLSGVTSNIQNQINAKQTKFVYMQKDKTAQAPNAGDVYSVTVTFTASADGYDMAKDTGMFSVYSDTNSIRIVSVTKDTSEFSNTKVQYYVLFTGTTNGAIGTITFRIQTEQ